MSVGEDVSCEVLLDVLSQAREEAEGAEMTLKEQYIREGIQQGFVQGFAQGFAQGFVQGFVQGFAQGIGERPQEGRHNALEKLARKLLASGMAPADVAEMVEWPLERVLALRH